MAILDDYKELKVPNMRKITMPKTGLVVFFGGNCFAIYKDGIYLDEGTILDIIKKNLILESRKIVTEELPEDIDKKKAQPKEKGVIEEWLDSRYIKKK